MTRVVRVLSSIFGVVPSSVYSEEFEAAETSMQRRKSLQNL